MNGILLVDKPFDWTSMDVCAKLRGAFHEKRIGHSGTLDPMATGLLVVFLGRATRAVEFAEADRKEYIARLRLGLTTDTQDTSGNVIAEYPVKVSKAQLLEAMERFKGEIAQIPPMYSAIKIGGKKLCDIARKGGSVERKPRNITIFELELLSFDGIDADIRVVCSKGTYIRTLCHDIGETLGCGGAMASLRRTKAGAFSLSEAHRMEYILAAVDVGAVERLLLPVDRLFGAYEKLTLTARQERALRNGQRFSIKAEEKTYRAYAEGGEFLALCRVENGELSLVKSFYEVN